MDRLYRLRLTSLAERLRTIAAAKRRRAKEYRTLSGILKAAAEVSSGQVRSDARPD